MTRRRPALLARFLDEERGATTLIFGLVAVSLVSFTGVTIDYGRASQTKSRLQSALDTAVIAGLKAGPGTGADVATRVFMSTFEGASAQGVQRNFTYSSDGALVGTASTPVKFTFGRLFGQSQLTVSSRTEGVLQQPPGRVCILLLDPTKPESLRVNGGVDLIAPECEVHIHSSAQPAAVFNGNSVFDTRRLCIKSAHYTANGNPKLGKVETRCAVAQDPFAGKIAAPDNLACTYTNKVFDAPKGKGKTHVPAGVYCGSTNFNGNQDIELEAGGLFVIKDGQMTVGGGSDITGRGVTIYLANQNSTFQVNGNSKIDLTAPTSGLREGVLFYEPNGLPTTNVSLNGGSSHRIEGLIYLPSREVTFNGASSMASEQVTMVLNSIIFNGASEWRLESSSHVVPASPVAGAGQIVLRQ